MCVRASRRCIEAWQAWRGAISSVPCIALNAHWDVLLNAHCPLRTYRSLAKWGACERTLDCSPFLFLRASRTDTRPPHTLTSLATGATLRVQGGSCARQDEWVEYQRRRLHATCHGERSPHIPASRWNFFFWVQLQKCSHKCSPKVNKSGVYYIFQDK
jgi:hypothetical protein